MMSSQKNRRRVKATMLWVLKRSIICHLLIDNLRIIVFGVLYSFCLVIDAVSFVMIEQQERDATAVQLLKKGFRGFDEPNGVIDVKALFVIRKEQVRTMLEPLRSTVRIEQRFRRLHDCPEIGPQRLVIREANEIGLAVPIVFEIQKRFRVAKEAGIDNPPTPAITRSSQSLTERPNLLDERDWGAYPLSWKRRDHPYSGTLYRAFTRAA